MFPSNPIIVVGGGLAGLCAAHQAYLRGANVVLLDKQGFLSGNSGKATSGINGALTRTQVDLSIRDSVDQFYQDTLASAKDRANPELIKVLTYNSADAVHWLQEVFELDLSIVSRLGGHSQPRTHRGKDAKFPGMAITYKLLETLENLAAAEPERVVILKNHQVVDLVLEGLDVAGVKYKDLKSKKKDALHGPVIMATGGYAADFTKNSLLRKYRPDIFNLPSTNGNHATGDGQKIIMKNHGVGIDLDKVQVHPTGLIDYDDKEIINGVKQPRFLFLGAEALRGEGGIMLNGKGQRFCDELGTRDYVSGEMEKQLKEGNGPIRLVLNDKAASNLEFHVKHYTSRNLMRTVSGHQLAHDLGTTGKQLAAVFEKYSATAQKGEPDEFGKKYYPNVPIDYADDQEYHVSFITRVLHFTMGGVKINDKTQVLYEKDGESRPFAGLYAAGEVAGGVHGHNRLGGSSLLACVVYGRVAADQATNFLLQKLTKVEPGSGAVAESSAADSSAALNRLKQINIHITESQVIVDWDNNGGKSGGNNGGGNTSGGASSAGGHASGGASSTGSANNAKGAGSKEAPKKDPSKPEPFSVPEKEFTAEEVAKHNTKDNCWCIVKGIVLDLTSFLSDHPGGEQSIINFAGKDATESFDMLHEDSVIPRYAAGCVLGRVKGEVPSLELK